MYVGNVGLPSTIVPSLSIVVGLMLVFRNGTSYDRFWTGRNCLTSCVTSVRNLCRAFLVSARGKRKGRPQGATGGTGDSGFVDALGVEGAAEEYEDLTDYERADTERTIRALLAILYAIKHNLRAEFRFTSLPPEHPQYPEHRSGPPQLPIIQVNGTTPQQEQQRQQRARRESELAMNDVDALLPDKLVGYEDQGLGLPVQLTYVVEGYIRRGYERGWFHGPQASQMTVQLNSLVDAFGKMETIRTTPLPVAHL
jgi:ion channel-forming bestrophin family protein